MIIAASPIAAAPIAGSADNGDPVVPVEGILTGDPGFPLITGDFTGLVVIEAFVFERFDYFDSPVASSVRVLRDVLSYTQELTPQAVRVLLDQLRVSSSISNKRDLLVLLQELGKYTDAVTRGTLQLLHDSLEGTTVINTQLFSRLFDILTWQSQAVRAQFLVVAAAINIFDSLARQAREFVQEQLINTASFTTETHLTLFDITDITGTVAFLREVLTRLEETLQGESSLSAVRSRAAALTDTFFFGGVLALPEGQYEAWVLNLENFGLSQYLGWNFNSFAGNYAANATGIYYLEGDTDAGAQIDAHVLTDWLDFEHELGPEDANKAHNLKRNPIAYLAGTSDGRLMLQVRATNQVGQLVEDWFEVGADRIDPTNHRFFLGRRNLARFFQYKLTNVAGSDFDISNFAALVVLQERKW